MDLHLFRYDRIRGEERLHDVEDPRLVVRLAESIRQKGWNGPPLVMWGPTSYGNTLMLTGVHRMAALDLLDEQDPEGIPEKIPVAVVDQRELTDTVADRLAEKYGIYVEYGLSSLDSDAWSDVLGEMGYQEEAKLVRAEGWH